jgi:alkylation response protein AidB-like acyl-CoA dehydrogenase
LRAHWTELAEAAAADDEHENFPGAAMAILDSTGCPKAVLPASRGGTGLGWKEASWPLLYDTLRAIGGAHLSAARLFEGHVNAFQLLWTFGTPIQRGKVCSYVADGGWLAVWNAPSAAGGMTLLDAGPEGFRLRGFKAYASGAGHIRRPLVTATHDALGLLMIWPDLDCSPGPPEEWRMHGMRSSVSRSIHYDGIVRKDQVFGGHDDYHRQPFFSGGAWRFLAAQLGAGEILCEWMRRELRERGRSADPHQRARLAECMLQLETAAMWIASAAGEDDPSRSVVRTGMARLAVERCLLDVVELVQRSVGLAAFSRLSPIERIARDLLTYLRQPAPDALRDSIGASGFDTPVTCLIGSPYASES